MSFELTPDVDVQRDRDGRIRQLEHAGQPYAGEPAFATADAMVSQPLRAVADQYVRDVLPLYGLEADMATALAEEPADALTEDPNQLRFVEEKAMRGSATVSYAQTCYGIPVWDAGVAVRMEAETTQVVGSTSSVQYELNIERPPADAPYLPEAITPEVLVRILGPAAEDTPPTLHMKRLYVFRYREDARTLQAPEPAGEDDYESFYPELEVPPPSDAIEEGKDYVVCELLFTLPEEQGEPVNWSALIDVVTGSILYIRPLLGCFAAHAEADVYLRDPITKTGDTALTPGASEAELNAHRDGVELHGLKTAGDSSDQELMGEYIHLKNLTPPSAPPPSSPAPGTFKYSVPTDDFSAVNAYHNCDRLFRLLDEMGLDAKTYFNGTHFPVPVDHRATINNRTNTVNAQAPGNALRTGSNGFRFALAKRDTSVGIADDWRVVLHEFGHALLWDNVHWPNFGFAHSAGDSLAAILNDPGNQAERMVTFPWVKISRRHDRRPEDGWAWGGARDAPFTSIDRAGYVAEQILSSTLFRIYQSAGGDDGRIRVQEFAAHYVSFLIIKAIGLLSPTSNPGNAEAFAGALMQADAGTFMFRGEEHPCGALRKVVRWGFEQQGAYQAPGAPDPVTGPGAPPAIDVYVNDGRAGTYAYQADGLDSEDVWVRRAPDGGTDHETPTVGEQHAVYARVRNRGTEDVANGVRVEAFRSTAPGEPVWPGDWEQLGPGELAVPDALQANDQNSVVVGPFEWVPEAESERLLVRVDAPGDLCLAALFSAAKPVPSDRLVPFDNNVAQRTVSTHA